MKNIYRPFVIICMSLFMIGIVSAGNDERRSTSGAAQLMLNPWAKSSGWGGVNTANGRGLDALYTNVAGLAFVGKTEVNYANTILFPGSGLNVNAAGLGQKVGSSGVLGLSFMSIAGDAIDITTDVSPEAGNNGTFRTTNMNINLSYAHSFSDAIHVGATVKIVNEGTELVSAMGAAIDAGIQYVTGEYYQMKFGISLKNIGSKMSFDGSGLSKTAFLSNDGGTGVSLEERSLAFEMPTQLNIGVAYDFLFGDDKENYNSRLTLAGNFTSNAFKNDYYIVGAEYDFFKYFELRGGYIFEKNIFKESERATAFTGWSVGASVNAPIGKEKDGKSPSILGINYAYRHADPLGGCHTIGVSFNL